MDLPPLNALRAFEAAARAGGFIGAARELGVSAAAVSQHVRNLEAYYGRRLFERRNNRVTLTDAGRAVQAEASESLQRLAELSARMSAGDRRARLVVSAPFSLVDGWLTRRVARLAVERPGLGIEIRTEEDPVAFERGDLDLRICYGDYLYPDLDIEPLFHDHAAPLASPAFLTRLGAGADADRRRRAHPHGLGREVRQLPELGGLASPIGRGAPGRSRRRVPCRRVEHGAGAGAARLGRGARPAGARRGGSGERRAGPARRRAGADRLSLLRGSGARAAAQRRRRGADRGAEGVMVSAPHLRRHRPKARKRAPA